MVSTITCGGSFPFHEHNLWKTGRWYTNKIPHEMGSKICIWLGWSRCSNPYTEVYFATSEWNPFNCTQTYLWVVHIAEREVTLTLGNGGHLKLTKPHVFPIAIGKEHLVPEIYLKWAWLCKIVGILMVKHCILIIFSKLLYKLQPNLGGSLLGLRGTCRNLTSLIRQLAPNWQRRYWP